MTGNLHCDYIHRSDRLRRLRERYRRGELTDTVFRRMLAYEGYTASNANAEIDWIKAEAAADSFRPFGEIAGKIVERIKP